MEKLKELTKKIWGATWSVIVGITLGILVITFLFQFCKVDGSSMEPNYHDRDRKVINKIVYKISDIKRYDVVAVRYKDDSIEKLGHKVTLIKRVIGLPGDMIRIDDNGNLYINDKLVDEPYIKEPMKSGGIIKNNSDGHGLVLKENEYFVMGDNRNNSLDSRTLGVFTKKDIIGRIKKSPYKETLYVPDEPEKERTINVR